MQQQANVNEALESAFLWVDASAGNDSNPGTQLLPLKTIGAAAAIAVASNSQGVGTQININPGTYRESLSLTGPSQPNAPITFQAPSPGTVFVSGAVSYKNWTPYAANPNVYTTAWTNQWGLCAADGGSAPFEPPIVLRREMVFVNGTQMTEVLSLSQMLFPGTFFVDEVNGVIYVWPPSTTDMSSADVEVATLSNLLTINNFSNLVFRNIAFEYAGSCHQELYGAVSVQGAANNLLFDTDAFNWNGGQGLTLNHPVSVVTVQNSSANHNGAAGFQSIKAKNIAWLNVEASYNNWRGAQGAYYTWNTGGAHIFSDHEETVSGFRSIYNQTFAAHWDTDVQNLSITGFASVSNLSGVLFESAEGPIGINGSLFCNTQRTASGEGGLVVRDTEYLSLTNSTLYNNGNSQITTSGIPGGVPLVRNWETGASFTNLNTQNLSLSGNMIQGVGSVEEDFRYGYIGSPQWTKFQQTLVSNNNTWWADNTSAFTVATPKPGTIVNFTGWQAATGQDSLSTFSMPANPLASACAVTPDAPDWQLLVDNGVATADATGSAVFNLTTVAVGAFSGTATFAVDGLAAMPGSTVSFTPASIGIPGTSTLTFVAGPQTPGGTYTFTVLANVGDTTRTVALTVKLANPALTIAPSALTYAAQAVGTASSAQTVTLTNSGVSPVSVLSIGLPAGFTESDTCAGSVAAGMNCTVSVVFSPQALVPYSGLLTLTFPGLRPQAIPITGTAMGTSATLLSAGGSAFYGQPASFTATVTGSPAGITPTGTVTFLDGQSALGSAALNTDGTATWTASSLSTGPHSITAAYAGDTNFFSSTSTPVTETVNPAATSVVLGSSSAASTYGMPFTFTAAVTPATATGTVQFLVDGVVQSAAPLSSGTSVYSNATLLPGTHQITSYYPGDANDAAATSAPVPVTVSQIAAQVGLTASPNPVQADPVSLTASVTLTATLNPLSATGNITFLDGTATLATVQLSGGIATTTVTLSVGTHALSAMYGGDALDLTSTGSGTETVYNTPAGSAVAVTPIAGDTLTFDTVSQLGITSITSTPISDPSFPAPLPANYQPVPASNFFTLSTTAITSGSISICFSYAGVTYTQPSTLTLLHYDSTLTTPAWTPTTSQTNMQSTTTICGSATTLGSFVIVQNTTATLALTSSANPSAYGQSVTFTATLTPSAAMGSVTFTNGAAILGTVTPANGVAMLSTSQLSAGGNNIVATYTDSSNFFSTATSQLTQTVTPATTMISLMSSAGTSVYGMPFTFTAAVTPATATGTVQFLVDGVVQNAAALSSGTAVYSTAALLPGTHQITASYPGDANDAAATSAPVPVTVSQYPAQIMLTAAPSPALADPVNLTASVTLTAALTPLSATGNVTFLDGTTTLATVQLSSGIATTTVALNVGPHNLSAMYGGDALDSPSTGTGSETVYNTPVGTAVAVTPTTGDTLTFDTVSQLGITSITSTPITDPSFPAPLPANYQPAPASNFFTLATTAITSGSISICLSYAGVTYTQPSTLTLLHYDTSLTPPAWTSTTSQTNTQSTTTICGSATTLGTFVIVQNTTAELALGSSANPSAYGQSVTFTATLTPSAAMGSVTFTNGGAILGTVTPANGVAMLSTSQLSTGANNIVATYTDSSNFFSTATGQLTQTVTPASSMTTLMSSSAMSVYGQPVTLTAVVAGTPAGLTPTGSVTFKDGLTTLATVALSNGQAGFTTSTLPVTRHSISAVYSGDTIFPSSTSAVVTQTVTKASTTVGVVSSLNPSAYGQSVVFTASVSAATPGSGVPTGTIIFKDGSTSYPGVNLSGGQGSLTLSTLGAGAHSITASYSGDSSFNKNTSAVLSQTVTKPSPVITVTSSVNPSVYGQATVFSAIVAPASPGSVSPTGTVTFQFGSTKSKVALSAGQAMLSVSTLGVGSISVTASYSGDNNYAAGTPAVFTQQVNLASTQTSLVSSANPAKAGQPVTFTATVAALAPGQGAPTGKVTFSDGATVLGTSTVSSGKAALKTSALASGSHSITAAYSGDSHFNPSSASALTQTIK